MQGLRGTVIAAVAVLGVPLVGCGSHDGHAVHAEHPAEVEHLPGSELSRVTLTEKAIERIDLRTDSVREESMGGATRRVVPYSSIIYDPQGGTWVYTSPNPRTFVRARIVVDRIDGDRVYLNEGPPTGTVVASVGVAELYGTEFQVGH